MSKATPGPWAFSQSEQFGRVSFYVSQADGAPYTPDYSDVATLVAETVSGERRSIQEANARLIAAAPELLDACKAAMQCIGELSPTQARVEVAQMLTAVISKATGEQA